MKTGGRKKDRLNKIKQSYLAGFVQNIIFVLVRLFEKGKKTDYSSIRNRPSPVQTDGKVEQRQCNYCGLCERICPSLALNIEHAGHKREEEKLKVNFEINYLRCIFCASCINVCPENVFKVNEESSNIYLNRRDAIKSL